NVSATREKSGRPPVARATRYAPTTPSRVLPAAIPREVPREPAVVMLTRKAPTKIAGQIRYPRSTKAANVIPVGAHTAVALGWRKARYRPTLPASTYRTQTPRAIPRREDRGNIAGIIAYSAGPHMRARGRAARPGLTENLHVGIFYQDESTTGHAGAS